MSLLYIFCAVCITHIIIVWCTCICTYVQYQHFSFYDSVAWMTSFVCVWSSIYRLSYMLLLCIHICISISCVFQECIDKCCVSSSTWQVTFLIYIAWNLYCVYVFCRHHIGYMHISHIGVFYIIIVWNTWNCL